MGQFLVQNNAVEDLAIASFTRIGNDPERSHLQFQATPGTTYTVQYSPDMTTSSWIDVGSITSNGTSADFYRDRSDAARTGARILSRGHARHHPVRRPSMKMIATAIAVAGAIAGWLAATALHSKKVPASPQRCGPMGKSYIIRARCIRGSNPPSR